MKEKRLTPAESFSLGSGVRGALIARTGSLIASGGSAVCCWTAGGCGCCAGCPDCPVCPAAIVNTKSRTRIDARNGLDIFFLSVNSELDSCVFSRARPRKYIYIYIYIYRGSSDDQRRCHFSLE